MNKGLGLQKCSGFTVNYPNLNLSKTLDLFKALVTQRVLSPLALILPIREAHLRDIINTRAKCAPTRIHF